MAVSDAHLVRRVLDGEHEVFGILIERYSGLVHALIWERVRRPGEVEDLVQESFCKAYEGLVDLRRTSRFAPWLAGIAEHTALRWVRHQQASMRAEELTGNWEPPPVATPDQELERNEEARSLWAALDRLPADLRRLVLLYHVEGCSYRELARFTSIPLATVRWRVRHAERQLGRALVASLGLTLRARAPDRSVLRRTVLAGLPATLPWAAPSRGALPGWESLRHLPDQLAGWSPAVVMVSVLLGVGAVFHWRGGFTTDEMMESASGSAAKSQGMRLVLGPPTGETGKDTWEAPPPPPDPARLRGVAVLDTGVPVFPDPSGPPLAAADSAMSIDSILTHTPPLTHGKGTAAAVNPRRPEVDPYTPWLGQYRGIGTSGIEPRIGGQETAVLIEPSDPDTLWINVFMPSFQGYCFCFAATLQTMNSCEGEILYQPGERLPSVNKKWVEAQRRGAGAIPTSIEVDPVAGRRRGNVGSARYRVTCSLQLRNHDQEIEGVIRTYVDRITKDGAFGLLPENEIRFTVQRLPDPDGSPASPAK